WKTTAEGLAPDVFDFLESGMAPIVFTPGTAMRHGRAFFDAAVTACRQLGRRALFVSPYRDQIPTGLPSDVQAFDAIPYRTVCPPAAAMVHHGGIGPSARGLATGFHSSSCRWLTISATTPPGLKHSASHGRCHGADSTVPGWPARSSRCWAAVRSRFD